MATLKTDFADGEVLYAGTTSDTDKLNGITNEVNRKGVIHRKVYSSAAEETTTAESFEDTAKTFNLSAPVNSLIIGINVIAQLKNGGENYTYASLKISGTNLGTKYLTTDDSYSQYTTSGDRMNTPFLNTSEKYLFFAYTSTYQQFSVSFNKPIKVLDTTTTFLFRMKRNGGVGYLKNVVVEVIYVEGYTEDA